MRSSVVIAVSVSQKPITGTSGTSDVAGAADAVGDAATGGEDAVSSPVGAGVDARGRFEVAGGVVRTPFVAEAGTDGPGSGPRAPRTRTGTRMMSASVPRTARMLLGFSRHRGC